MTSQVSDVSVTTAQMRRTTLAHSILSFVFNIAVLAMSINVIGGVILDSVESRSTWIDLLRMREPWARPNPLS